MEYMPEKDEKDGINTWRGVRLPRTMFEMVETAEVSNWVLPAIVQPQMSPDRRACRKPNCASALLGVLGHLVGAKSAVPYLKIPRQICHFQHKLQPTCSRCETHRLLGRPLWRTPRFENVQRVHLNPGIAR